MFTETVLFSIANAITNTMTTDEMVNYLSYGRVIRAEAGTGNTACVIVTSHGNFAVRVEKIGEE